MEDQIERLATMFKALGDPMRLRMLTFLRSCSCAVSLDDQGAVRRLDGPTVGEVCCHVTGLSKVTSTLSFHLKELRQAGLIRTARRGRFIVCCVNADAIEELRRYFADDLPEGCPDCHTSEGKTL